MSILLQKLEITINNSCVVNISPRKKSYIKKAVIEEFLPRFGNNSKILYLSQTVNHPLYIEEAELKKLNFFKLSHDELPDIIAYSKKKKWLYLIEAVHSSGPMSETRVLELKKMLKDCKAGIVFVTTFLTKNDFRKWALDIAWETEVWTADNPDHLIHFNGHKFLGPME